MLGFGGRRLHAACRGAGLRRMRAPAFLGPVQSTGTGIGAPPLRCGNAWLGNSRACSHLQRPNMTHANRTDGQDRSWLSNPASHSSTGSTAILRRRTRRRHCCQMCCRQWSRVLHPLIRHPLIPMTYDPGVCMGGCGGVAVGGRADAGGVGGVPACGGPHACGIQAMSSYKCLTQWQPHAGGRGGVAAGGRADARRVGGVPACGGPHACGAGARAGRCQRPRVRGAVRSAGRPVVRPDAPMLRRSRWGHHFALRLARHLSCSDRARTRRGRIRAASADTGLGRQLQGSVHIGTLQAHCRTAYTEQHYQDHPARSSPVLRRADRLHLHHCPAGGDLSAAQVEDLQRMAAGITAIAERRAAFIALFLEPPT